MKLLLPLACAFALLTSFVHAGEIESAVLREINLARTNPEQYSRLLAQNSSRAVARGDRDTAEAIRFLKNARPLPPLARSTGLGLGAQLHVTKQGASGGRGHGNCFSRMERFGNWIGRAGENISYGQRDARSIVCSLIIDKGVSGRGHRKNIFNSSFGVAGVAYGRHAAYGAMCVIDFAGQFVERGGALASL